MWDRVAILVHFIILLFSIEDLSNLESCPLRLLKEHIIKRRLLRGTHRLIERPLVNMNGLIALILFIHHLVLCTLMLHIEVIFIAVVFSVVLVVIQVSEDRLLN